MKSALPNVDIAFEAGPSQRRLLVRLEGDTIHAVACKAKDCDPKGAFGVRPPPSLRKNVESSRLEDIKLANGKHLALVRVPAEGGRFYGVLLASVDGTSEVPKVVWSGFAGGSSPDSGLLLKRNEKGAATSFGLADTALLCGREVPIGRRSLDPNKLTLKDEPLPDPIGSLRPSATALKGVSEPKPVGVHPVLHATVASSGDADAISDGNRATSWVENQVGPGLRSFVSLSAPEAVTISGFDLSFDPKGIVGARAPRALSLVTDAGVYAVTLADDAVAAGGASFGVELPKPIHTKCVGVVVDEVHKGDKAAGEPAVFISEIVARTSADKDTLEDLARGLGSATPEAKARESILMAAREAGIAAIARVYPSLEPAAKDRARRIVDATPCEQRLKVYLPLLEGPDREESDRARDRIRRCGKDAGPVLVSYLGEKLPLAQRGAVAEEAALVAPQLVMGSLFEALGKATTADERLAFRKAIAKGALREAGRKAIDTALAGEKFGALPTSAKVDVVRALGPTLGESKNGAAAFDALAKDATEFRDRYLLLPAAAELARTGSESGIAFLRAATEKGGDHRLRARAAELAYGVPKLEARVVELLDDEKVRVREAALLSLTRAGAKVGKDLQAKLVERLVSDKWTFVRRAAISALAAAPSDAPLDAKIAARVDWEESAGVRAEMMNALAARNARKHTNVVASRAFDQREAVEVRSAAVLALGKLCERDAVDPLTELVLRGATPQFEADRKLGLAATEALGVLRPFDLAARLATVTKETAPPEIRAVAKKAIASTEPGCK